MTLKDLMQLCFRAGRENVHDPAMGWDWWWHEYGEERHNDFADALDDVPMERLVDKEDGET